jgi:hypothetical protein
MDDSVLFDEIVKATNLWPRIEDDQLQKHPDLDTFSCRAPNHRRLDGPDVPWSLGHLRFVR